ncbi:hypothetical protein EVAR_90257_1 [Eumeta japonica]|uniref:Tumour suppressor p53-binding protein-1 Tudor domain-containing protein n=1 Tax=Eumeta variegata TaxID=151549 RepID=A0A4C2ADW9_EUMVA|nr:hypothetical protein EVAR_90257_1 [Eumeta japonica]
MSNGNASPEEVGKCDKVTPKSSPKDTNERKKTSQEKQKSYTPTQAEEPEYMHGVNSPEIIPMNGESKDLLIKTSLKEEKLQGITGTPKSVNKLKQKKSRPTSPRPPTPVEKGTPKTEFLGYPPDTLVLAKWVDKRYYSGKVLELIEPNKYLIKFDDSRTKVLLDDFIIFGNMKTLPLQGQSVYALVDEEENYEPGLVLGVEENSSGAIIYRCTTDGSRSARSRDKGGNSSAKKRIASPKSPKASNVRVKDERNSGRKRLASESSELSESSNRLHPCDSRRSRRRARGAADAAQDRRRQRHITDSFTAKKNSKLAKFENDADTVSVLGPIHHRQPTIRGNAFPVNLCRYTEKNQHRCKD